MEIREEFDGTYLIKLNIGDEIISSLEKFADENGIYGATFQGIGAVNFAEIGFFDLENKEYARTTIDGQREVLSLKGNIGRDGDGEVMIHAHIILGDKSFATQGGHLFKGKISVTGEIRLLPSGDIKREHEQKTGLKLWKLSE